MRDRSVPLAIMLAGLAGCQSMPADAPATSSEVVSVYASPFDAATVAAGRFGAVPVASASKRDLEAATQCPDAASGHNQAATCVRTRTGTMGWVPSQAHRLNLPVLRPASSGS